MTEPTEKEISLSVATKLFECFRLMCNVEFSAERQGEDFYMKFFETKSNLVEMARDLMGKHHES